MFFVDEAEIHVKAGKGGDGCVSFRREKYVPRGGPNGGDGGKGGDVIMRASVHLATLMDMRARAHCFAPNGQPGMGHGRHGKSGQDVIIEVPVGTIVKDKETGLVLKDFKYDGETVVIAKGGRGGRGNMHFATPTNRAPRQAEKGKPGQERHLILELKLMADVGLVGLPNAGKSTILSRLSKARPKIADYPFTTLQPHLGIVELSDYRRFVMADLPGIISGAHAGAGLGEEFLRHIERTRLLVHVIDMAPPDGSSPLEAYHAIRKELALYSEAAAVKPEIVAANKMDLPDSTANLAKLKKLRGVEIVPVSAATGKGLRELTERIWRRLAQAGG